MSDDEQCPSDEAFHALTRGELTTAERALFHAHVDRCGSCQLLLRELAGAIDVEAVPGGTGTSDYRLEARLGQGGMGVVYRATDVQLGRSVALKLPPRLEPTDPPGPADALSPADAAAASSTAWLEARFLREALLTARLQHPGIVPIHQVGRWPTGDVFYTMKLISGRSLRDLIDAARGLDERLALLPHVLAAADAVGYAHAQGVIHRDLKPANIMCGPFGETVVIDWGLAKQLDLDESSPDIERELDQRALALTSPGLVLGTASYMAPEQARGEAVDARADVFALGVILHHLLTGSAPILRAGPPASWPPGAPPDLIALVRKATAMDPRERYATAKHLADDLRRFHTGQLVGARVYSTSTLIWRWLARHRSLVVLALLFVGVLVASEVLSVRRIVRERQVAVASRNELVVLQARSAMATDPTEALGWLKLADGPTVDWTIVRAVAEDALGRGVARHVLKGHESPVGVIAVAPGGKFLASADRQGAVWLWSMATGEGWAIFHHPKNTHIAFSADGAILATSGGNGVIQLYWLATGARCPLRGHTGAVTALAMGPERASVVSGGADGTVRVSSCDGAMQVLGSHTGAVNAVAVSPRGDVVASAGTDGTIALWTLATGQSRILRGHDGEVITINFRKDGQVLASGGADATVRIWSVMTGEARVLRGHTRMVHDVKFAPSGPMLASAGTDWLVMLWDSTTGDSRTLTWDQVPWVIAFSPRGDRVAAAGLGGGVRLWDLPGRYSWDLRGHKGAVYDVVFASDDTVATAGEDGSVRVWENANLTTERSDVDTRGVRRFALSADGSMLALGGTAGDPSVRLRPVDGAERLLGHRPGGAPHVALSADGRWLAASGAPDRTIGVWNVQTGELTELRGHDEPVEDLAFTAGGLIASAGLDGTVRLWEPDTGKVRTLRGHDSWVYSVSGSPDGKQLASGGRDGTVRLWDLGTGEGRVLLRHPGQVRTVTFSADGKLVASADLVSGVGISEVATGRGRVLAGHQAWVYDVAFSPDGRRMVSGSADGTVRLWTAPWDGSRVLARHDGPVRSVAYSPDGTTVASSGHDMTVRISSVDSGASRVLRGHTSKVLGVGFFPDGKRVLSSGEDGRLIQWSVPVLTDSPPATPGAVAPWLAQLTTAAIESNHRLATPRRRTTH